MQENETIEAIEAIAASEAGGAAAPGDGRRMMSKREAVGRLLEISKNRDLTVEDVTAIQLGVRSLCKRIFDRERNRIRRREREAAVVDPASGTGAFLTPPEAPETVPANPPAGDATGSEGQQADDSKGVEP